MAMETTPAEQAAFDQASASLRDRINILVDAYREIARETTGMDAKSALAKGFANSEPLSVMAIAIMAVAMLAEKES